MESLELFEQSLQSFFLATLHELSHKIGGGVKANASALGTSGKCQSADQVSFTGSRVSD